MSIPRPRQIAPATLGRRMIAGLALFLSPGYVFAQGAFTVHFDQSRYQVGPGGSFAVSALIEPVPVAGLFSFGVRIIFAPPDVQISSPGNIIIPAPLDFNGPQGPGGTVLITPGGGRSEGHG